MTNSNSPRKHLKIWILVLSCVLVLSLGAAGITIAFLNDRTETLDNQFDEAYVTCLVNRNGEQFSVTNTGNIQAFIRVAIVVNWMDESGNVRGLAPSESDYTVVLNSTNWAKYEGYYYYLQPVAPDAETAQLIQSITLNTTAPEGYHLTVEVVAEALQADGVSSQTGLHAIVEAWLGAMI